MCVEELMLAWQKRLQIYTILRIERQRQVVQHIFNLETTSCAQFRVVIVNFPFRDFLSAIAEFLHTIAAGPHVLNDLVLRQPCPLAWCKYCDEMDLQLAINVDTRYVSTVFGRELVASKESIEYCKLREVLLRCRQHIHVPQIRLTFDLYDSDQYLALKLAAILRRKYDVRLTIENEAKCYRNREQQFIVSNREQPHVLFECQTDRTCPSHQLNYLYIVLIHGDVSTYIPTRLWNFRMQCGRHPEVVLFAAPFHDAVTRARQVKVACEVDTEIPHEYINVSYGQVNLDQNGLVMVLWNENSLTEAPQPAVMDWNFSRRISDRRLNELLTLVGAQLRQVKIYSLFDTIKFSQLVMILDQCPLIHEISVDGLMLENVQQHYRSNDVPLYPHLQAVTLYATPNVMMNSVLVVVGQSFKRLKLISECPMDANTSRIIASACPQLRALHVDTVDHTFCPTLVALVDQGYLRKMKALTLKLCSSSEENNQQEYGDHPLLIALQDPRRAITRCIRELSVAHGKIQSRSIVTEGIMSNLLSLNNTLVNVHFRGTKYEHMDKHLVRAMRPFPPRYVSAVLSGLQRVLRMPTFCQFPIELIQLILAFTGRPAYRIGFKWY